jgi:predicted ATP-grasp superfamily ATP-dependent carboligase
MKNTALHPVVILELMFAGYGIARSLWPYNIPVIGFSSGRFRPPTHTRFVDQLVFFEDHDDLLAKLQSVAAECDRKPVLILTGDTYVNFAAKNIELLRSLFLIDFPEQHTVDLLLDKTAFSSFAKQHQLLIPQTEVVSQASEVEALKDQLTYPVIVKPYQKTKAWHQAKFPKGFMADDFEALQAVYEKIASIEPQVIVQEWVPGGDDQIAFCLVYYDKDHQCVAHFTGTKVRQWPVGKGSTSIARPLDDEWVSRESLQLFDLVKFTGLGSVEYKKHERNGKYYIIEPTVGRVNAQEYVATANGVNLPLAAYTSLTGHPIQPKAQPKRPVAFIHEVSEISRIRYALKKKTLKLKDLFRSPVKGPRVYAYSTLRDPKVGMMVFLHLFGKFFKPFK